MSFKFNPFTGNLDVTGNKGTVTNVTASSPIASSGGTTPNISLPQSNSGTDGYLSQIDWNTFNNKAPINSPNFTGVPTSPTPSLSDSSTKIATTAFVQSQGFLTSSGSIPTGEQDNASVITSASATFVTALTSTVTITQTTSIYVIATFNLKATSAACVAQVRTNINSVGGRVQNISLLNITDNYVGVVQQQSVSLSPGTYTIKLEISRLSGTGTVNYTQGTLFGWGIQGTNSNGITQLTGALQAGPGSGSQVLSGVLPVANGGTNLSSTTINQILYSSTNNIISGLSTANTGALVTSNTGVPSITTGVANRLLRSNGTTVSFAQANVSTDVTGTLPIVNGGTGSTSFANQRIPFSNGSILTSDANFFYDTTNQRFCVGGTGTATGNFIVTAGSKTALQGFNQSAGNAVQAVNQTAYSFSGINRSNSSMTGASLGLEFGRGTVTSPLQALNGDQLGVIVANGYTGTQTSPGFSGAISFIASENVTNTANGGELVFSTTPNTTLTPIEQIRIKNTGETVFQKAIATAQYTTTNKLALTPSPGWVVFDTTLNKLSYYNGTTWINL